MPEALRLTLTLCRLKTRLLLNSLKSWASLGKGIGVTLSVVLTAVLITTGAADLVNSLRMVPYADIMLDWLLGGIIIYVIFVVFTGDLLTGHSLNTGQMSSDFGYLRTLPLPPISLVVVKLFERLITDYLGLIILYSAFLGIACRNACNLESLLLATALYLQISLLIGLLINLTSVFLTRFFRPTAVNNFFSLLGYFSAFITVAPYVILNNFPMQILEFIVANLDILNETVFRFMVPVQWLAVALLSGGFCDEFFFFAGFWAVAMLAGTLLFKLAIDLNWYSYSHSSSRKGGRTGRKWFSGLIHKEVLLLKSDFNLLVNAMMMPITLIIVEILLLKEVFKLSSPGSMLNIIAGAVIYFCGFGPVNSIGYEGKAISLLETLPIKPSSLLLKKAAFWIFIAEVIFVPATVLSMQQMNFAPAFIAQSALVAAIFTAACVLASVCVSAVFPCFDSKVLQQRSTLAGKLAALGLMLLMVPVKDLSQPSIFSFVVFACLLYLMFIKARAALFFRLDPQAQNSEYQKQIDVMLLTLAFAAGEISLTHMFHAVAPGIDTGMWNWFIPAVIILPISALLMLSHRAATQPDHNPAVRRGFNSPAVSWGITALLLAATIVLTISLHVRLPETAALFRDDLFQIADLARTVSLPPTIWCGLLIVGSAMLSGLFVCHLGRRFPCHGRGSLLNTLAGIALLTLLFPARLMPAGLIIATAVAAANRLTGQTRHAIVIGALASAAQGIYFIFF